MKKLIYAGVIALWVVLTPVSVRATETNSQEARVENETNTQDGGIDQPAILLLSLAVVTAAALAVSTKKK